MKILVADDDPVTRRTLTSLLEDLGHESIETCDGLEAWDAIHEIDAPALLILDWMMPGLSGVQICRALRQSTMRSYQYILMVTARDATDDMVEALEAGADEYLKKPFNFRELQARVRVAERLLLVQNALVTRSTTDELTGVLNRRGIFERIERELALVSRNARPLSLILIDADNFKTINDTYGHAIGDEVLKALAGRIRSQLRPYDDVGRHGGEEFAVLLPACAPSDGPSVAERIRRAVYASPIIASAGPIAVTISAGVTGVRSTAVLRTQSVIAAADKALYTAKNNGRNRTEYAEPLQPASGAAA